MNSYGFFYKNINMYAEITQPALLFSYFVAAYIRIWLIFSDYQEVIAEHIEVSTPINSWKRGMCIC